MRNLRIAVTGGSVAGLAAGIALRGIGADVHVYERDPGPMRAKGAGIVVQPDLTDLLERHNTPPLPVTGCRTRRYLTPDGKNAREVAAPQQFTSWEAIYHTMRAAFDEDRYHLDARVAAHQESEDGLTVAIDGTSHAEVDLLVAADGAQSATRAAMLPNAAARYAGYIAWRGTLAEADAPADLVATFEQRFTFCAARSGGHMLVYLIPGDGAETATGERRLNWVWYVAVAEGELKVLLRDRFGQAHHASLPPGLAPDATVAAVQACATAELAPEMANLVAATPDPFIQTITDQSVERTAFSRVLLIGDAAFIVRPHTAAAAAKACYDATALAQSLARHNGDVASALKTAERRQLRLGNELVERGIALGSDWPSRRAASR